MSKSKSFYPSSANHVHSIERANEGNLQNIQQVMSLMNGYPTQMNQHIANKDG